MRRCWRRYQVHGLEGLEGRPPRPQETPRAIPSDVRQKEVEIKRHRRTIRAIASETGISKTSVARIVKEAGLSRLRTLDPPEPHNRYEYPAPGDMLHVDIKKLAKFETPGHRVTGTRTTGCSRGAGFDYVFVAVDDHRRLALVGIYPDETQHSAADFLERAFQTMQHLGAPVRSVLTDNAKCFTSSLVRNVCEQHKVRHRTTRPYRPRTNGKAERFIQTLLREWAYSKTYQKAQERNSALEAWLRWYNEERPHTAIQGRPPITRLPNVLGLDS